MRAGQRSSGGQPLLSGDVGLFKDFLDEMGGDILAVGIGDGLSIPSSFHIAVLAATIRSLESELPESSNKFFA